MLHTGQLNWISWVVAVALLVNLHASDARAEDRVRELQKQATESKQADWGHWGKDKATYSSWTNHSNRLIPVYTFGITLDKYQGEKSAYRDAKRIEQIYGFLPPNTVNPQAEYFDQTDIYRLQKDAVAAGKKHVILFVFDGMDWQTTQAAAIYQSQKVYQEGRGKGLYFQEYDKTVTDYGAYVTSPHNSGSNVDTDAQAVLDNSASERGGYDAKIGGAYPWVRPLTDQYPLGQLRRVPHAVTDSASSATSLTSGIKTYNAAINVDHEGKQSVPIARQFQAERGFSIGVVTSVPISHATPAAAYSNNVHRDDYQDLTRDLVGLPSISHRQNALPGVDVLLGAGWGQDSKEEKKQGTNFVPGNKFLAAPDLAAIDVNQGGKYVVAQRTAGRKGSEVLMEAARQAYANKHRLFGFFGVTGGHLPFRTADGNYNPHGTEYSQADVEENPTLADMTRAALGLLSQNEKGFWLMVEAGDVDWANHANNIDDSIGAVISGDEAFRVITAWVEKNNAWDETAVILTADHGHYFVLEKPEVLAEAKAAEASGSQPSSDSAAAK